VENNRSFVLILLALVVLITLALWQFYSLACAGDVAHPHVRTVTSCPVMKCPSVAVH
jgi:hypothetical protein